MKWPYSSRYQQLYITRLMQRTQEYLRHVNENTGMTICVMRWARWGHMGADISAVKGHGTCTPEYVTKESQAR